MEHTLKCSILIPSHDSLRHSTISSMYKSNNDGDRLWLFTPYWKHKCSLKYILIFIKLTCILYISDTFISQQTQCVIKQHVTVYSIEGILQIHKRKNKLTGFDFCNHFVIIELDNNNVNTCSSNDPPTRNPFAHRINRCFPWFSILFYWLCN